MDKKIFLGKLHKNGSYVNAVLQHYNELFPLIPY